MSTLEGFLNEIEDEHHQNLLEKGNLGKRKPSLFREETIFHSSGYLAKALRITCGKCGTQETRLQGIFHRETNSLGTSRLTAMPVNSQYPLDQTYPIEIETCSIPQCYHCLPDCFSEQS